MFLAEKEMVLSKILKSQLVQDAFQIRFITAKKSLTHTNTPLKYSGIPIPPIQSVAAEMHKYLTYFSHMHIAFINMCYWYWTIPRQSPPLLSKKNNLKWKLCTPWHTHLINRFWFFLQTHFAQLFIEMNKKVFQLPTEITWKRRKASNWWKAAI